MNETNQFSKYILPNKPIRAQATAVTNLRLKNGKLFHRESEVKTSEKRDVLKSFIEWLLPKSLLIGHNIRSFDSRLLIHHILLTDMLDEHKRKEIIFADTLPLLKELLPNRRESKKSYKQSDLITDILSETYEAHDALADVLALQRLLSHLRVSNDAYCKHCFTVDTVHEVLKTNKRMETFRDLELVVTKETIRKLASSGLEMSHLMLAFRRGGIDGINGILTEKIAGKPRVTNNKRILGTIVNFVQRKINE